MPTTFVLRSHYEGPSEKYVRVFEDESVLAWFQARWAMLGENADDSPQNALGTDVYGFWSLGSAIAEHGIAAPDSMDALRSILEEHLYVEGEVFVGDHSVQVLTDDDELQLSYYFFDGHYEAANPGQADFLKRAEWQLPIDVREAEPWSAPSVSSIEIGNGDGTVWMIQLAYYDSGNLDDLEGPTALTGTRLDGLAQSLASTEPTGNWPFELRLLRSQLLSGDDELEAEEREFFSLIRKSPTDPGPWGVYGDWLLERGRRGGVIASALASASRFRVAQITNSMSTGDRLLGDLAAAAADAQALFDETGQGERARCHQSVSAHLAQLCLFTADWGSGPMFHQWILFDDVWAASHPSLATGLVVFSQRWNVLH